MVKDVPFIKPINARYLYDLILKEKLTRILELGIGLGTATCTMAAALDELGGGKITAVDLIEAKSIFNPSAEEQLGKSRLSHLVQISRMQTGYTWFLHDEIKRLTENDLCQPEYDLCVIDGPKNWTIDGCAFFLVDKVLKENGWIIFDDYQWTYAEMDKWPRATDGITHRHLSEPELKTPHIKEIFELLVKQHPNYGDLYVHPHDDWAIARKCASNRKTYTIQYKETHADVVASFLAGILIVVKRFLKIILRIK